MAAEITKQRKQNRRITSRHVRGDNVKNKTNYKQCYISVAQQYKTVTLLQRKHNITIFTCLYFRRTAGRFRVGYLAKNYAQTWLNKCQIRHVTLRVLRHEYESYSKQTLISRQNYTSKFRSDCSKTCEHSSGKACSHKGLIKTQRLTTQHYRFVTYSSNNK